MATKPTDAVNRINAANGNAYDATNNPGGLAQGGHRQNFVPDLQATVSVAQWSADSAAEAAASAVATAADRAKTTQDVTTTGQYRDRAQEWANKPEDQTVTSGLYSAYHYSQKSAAQVSLAANQVTLAANQADRSTTQADRSQSYAQGLNIPALNSSTALQFLRANAAGTAYEFTPLDLYSASLINRVARTSNTALAKADKGALIDITSGTFTQTFLAAATLGAGWFAYLRNAGSGDITLDPNGSETIDGLASFIMYPGEVRLIQCDGTALRSIVLEGGTKKFTSSGNLIWPPGVNGAIVECDGGGGGGGANGQSGGGGGGHSPPKILQKPAGTVDVATVGAAGLGGANGTSAGTAGGDSSFGSIEDGCYARGGNPGSDTGSGGNGGAAAKGVGVGFPASGFQGGFGSANAGGSAEYGGGAGGNRNSTSGFSNDGGGSIFGGGGGGSGATGGSVGGSGGRSGSYSDKVASGATVPPKCGGYGGDSSRSPAPGGFPGGGGGGGGVGSFAAGANGGAGLVTVRFF